MRFVETLLQAAIGFAIVAVAWWLAAWRVDTLLLPGPVAVTSKALELLSADAFREHMWASLTVLLFGLAPALALGLLIGALAGASTVMRWLLIGPVTLAVAAAPLVALVPLLTLSLGLGVTTKVVLVFLVAAFSTANTVMALWPRRAALKIVAPSGTPKIVRPGPGPGQAIFAGLRIGVLLGVTALVVGELAASNTGLATFVANSAQSFNATDAFAAALLIIVPTVAVGVLLQGIEEQLSA